MGSVGGNSSVATAAAAGALGRRQRRIGMGSGVGVAVIAGAAAAVTTGYAVLCCATHLFVLPARYCHWVWWCGVVWM